MDKTSLLPESPNRKIIKRDEQRVDSIFFGRILKNQVLNAEEQARNILLEANQKAIETVENAEIEANDIRRNAYESGREESIQELLEDVLEAKDQRSEALYSVEQDVLKLSVKVAEKIIGREIQLDDATRADIVLTALRQARQQEMLTVRVNANDLPLVEKMRERIDAFGRARYLDFVADQAVGEGGCLIESQSGTIDARLETQLRVFENALLAQISNEPEKD